MGTSLRFIGTYPKRNGQSAEMRGSPWWDEPLDLDGLLAELD
jgi:hypothetical protein